MTPITRAVLRLATASMLAAFALLQPAAAIAQEVPEAPLSRIAIGGEGIMLGSGALSPDGRWIVVEQWESSNRSSLWLAPAAGGEMVRLTDGGYLDERPEWAPTGDRVYFTSRRPARGETAYFTMAVRIDAQTGRPLDSPRQITIERQSWGAVPSPDGRQILYRDGNDLRIAPAMGGNSRVVTTLAVQTGRFGWAPDGSAIYYTAGDPRGQALYRLGVNGGEATEVFRVRGRSIQAIATAAQRAAVMSTGPGPRERTIEIMDWSGRVLARRVTSLDFLPRTFSADGRTLLVSSMDIGAIMRVRPVAGGEPIDLSDGRSYDWPMAWSADARYVIVSSATDEHHATRLLPVGGGAPRELPLPADEPTARISWATATHFTYMVPASDPQVHRLVAVDLASGERTVLSENARRAPTTGPGGLYSDVDGFTFAEIVGDRLHIRSASPGRPVRTLFSAPQDFLAQRATAFHGERFAYIDMAGDSVAVMMVDAPGAEPRILLTLGVPSSARACCRRNLSFSHDGEWLVTEPVAEPNVAIATLARVPRQGRATEIRQVPLDAEYWYEPRWTPDNSGFTVIAGSGASAWVAFVPTADPARVRHLSRNEERATWGNALSPDGRLVVYPAEVWRGSSLWRIDVR